MPDAGRPYVTLLLRLWQVDDSGAAIWRASLENSQTGERHGFADLGALFIFLRELTSVRPQQVCCETPGGSDGDTSGPSQEEAILCDHHRRQE